MLFPRSLGWELRRQYATQILLACRRRYNRAQHVAAHGPQHADHDAGGIVHRVEQIQGGLYVAAARILLENGARLEADDICHAVQTLLLPVGTIGRCCAASFVGVTPAVERAPNINNQINRGLLERAVRKCLEKTSQRWSTLAGETGA
jgi:hypothetical protein